MLFFTLLSLVVSKNSNKNHNNVNKETITVTEIKHNHHDNKPQAIVHTAGIPAGNEIYLMCNSNVDKQYEWVPVCKYDTIRKGNESEMVALNLDPNTDKNKHYCFMSKNERNEEVYSRPWNYSQKEEKWCPSRTEEQERIVVEKRANESPVYTTKQIEDKKTTTTTSKAAKKNEKNSAMGVFGGVCAAITLGSALLL